MLFKKLIWIWYHREKSLFRRKVMAQAYQITLDEQQKQELAHTRDHHAKPYIRVKAAAVLKVASGMSQRAVALEGLLKPVAEETVSRWVEIYQRDGIQGWMVKKGRGRKPAFSPSQLRSRASGQSS
jgi:hypothetical protein